MSLRRLEKVLPRIWMITALGISVDSVAGAANYIGSGSPNLFLHWDPSKLLRDGIVRLHSPDPSLNDLMCIRTHGDDVGTDETCLVP